MCQHKSVNWILTQICVSAWEVRAQAHVLNRNPSVYMIFRDWLLKSIRLQYLYIIQAQFNSDFGVLAWHKLDGLHASSHH